MLCSGGGGHASQSGSGPSPATRGRPCTPANLHPAPLGPCVLPILALVFCPPGLPPCAPPTPHSHALHLAVDQVVLGEQHALLHYQRLAGGVHVTQRHGRDGLVEVQPRANARHHQPDIVPAGGGGRGRGPDAHASAAPCTSPSAGRLSPRTFWKRRSRGGGRGPRRGRQRALGSTPLWKRTAPPAARTGGRPSPAQSAPVIVEGGRWKGSHFHGTQSAARRADPCTDP